MTRLSEVDVVRHPRARRARLSVDPLSGRVRLTLPSRAAVTSALAWAAEQHEWIAAQRERLPQPRPFVPGGKVPFAGGELVVVWDEARSRVVRREADILLCGGPLSGVARRVEGWLKREALRILTEETIEFAARAGVTVSKVAIGDPRGRWGSCASSGVIRYSWRLILAPRFVRRSTVAHEVAHRRHMNHSPAFHALAIDLDEHDPAESRAWLRQNGAALHWVGRSS